MLTFRYLEFPCQFGHQSDDRAYQSFRKCRHHLDASEYVTSDVMHVRADGREHAHDVCGA